MKTRKAYIENIRKIEDVLRIVSFTDDLYDSSDFKKQLFDRIIYFQNEVAKLPIGYEYSGVYYKKRVLEDFVKMEGNLYMREDLISWIDPNLEYPSYMRNIYKEADYSKPLLREHGKPVFGPKPSSVIQDQDLYSHQQAQRAGVEAQIN